MDHGNLCRLLVSICGTLGASSYSQSFPKGSPISSTLDSGRESPLSSLWASLGALRLSAERA